MKTKHLRINRYEASIILATLSVAINIMESELPSVITQIETDPQEYLNFTDTLSDMNQLKDRVKKFLI